MKPMLAIEYSKVKNLDISVGYYASPKLDGIRCVVLDGVAYSRSMKPIRNTSVQSWAKTNAVLLNGFDGELVSGSPVDDACFRNTSSIVMSEDGGSDWMFYVFDEYDNNLTYEQRYKQFKFAINTFRIDNVLLVEHVLVTSEQEVFKLEQEYIRAGYEGIMLTRTDSYYKEGRSGTKSPELIKKKLFIDAEYEIVGYEPLYHNANKAKINELGRTERSSHKENMVALDKLGSLVLKQQDGKQFYCGTGFDDNTRVDMWNNRDKLIGQYAKIKYFEQGNYDTPRFPVFLGIRSIDDVS